MKVMIDEEQKKLVKKFKTMLNQYGIDRNSELTMLASYNVESCKDMTVYELIEICDQIQKSHDEQYAKLDKKRKQLLAAVCAANGQRGYPVTIEYAKKTILHAATEFKSFNSIPQERLNSLYAAFKNLQKDLKKVSEINISEINHTSKLN